MNPHKNRPLDELLQESCNEEVLDRILEILEKKQRTKLEHQRGTGNVPPRYDHLANALDEWMSDLEHICVQY